MSLIFEQINTPGLAALSYLVGDRDRGLVAVIDPRRDVEVYLEHARAGDVRIAGIVETHIHADFVSGSHELAARTGAPIYGGRSQDYRFDILSLDDGAEIELGAVRLRALHSPGHTPEHIALLLVDDQQGQEPFGLLSGDLLFNLEVGRPDLHGEESKRELAGQLYDSLFVKLGELPDRIEVYPGHGAGSACGGSIGDRLQSTLGNERLFSPALKDRGREQFIDWLLGSLGDPPRYYAHLKKVNAAGAPLRGGTPLPAARDVDEFASLAAEPDVMVIDARAMEAWAAGHVQGAINLPADEHFPMWLGSVVDPEARILLIAEDQHALADAVRHAYRIGYDHLVGYLHGGMAAWKQAGREVAHSELVTVHQLAERFGREDLTVLDVRTAGERAGGYIPGSVHIPANQIAQRTGELDARMPVVTYCGTGYRAGVAASLLRRAGFQRAGAVPGSYRAWTAAGLEVAHDEPAVAGQSAPEKVKHAPQPIGTTL
jgi:hydroxyacylglutathione hydrolase